MRWVGRRVGSRHLERIDLHARHGEDHAEAMPWDVQHDRDGLREVWLRFESQAGQRFLL